MPWFFYLQHFQTWTKTQGTAARVIRSKAMAMKQRRCFGTLLLSLELLRVTPGKCQFWKAPENICRSLHLHKVVGKSCCGLWYSTACKQQWLLDETELFYLLLQLKGTLKISREDFPLCISDYALKMPWICTQRSNDVLPWLLPSCASVLAYPILSNHTEQGHLWMKAKGLCPGSWTQYFCTPLESAGCWMSSAEE